MLQVRAGTNSFVSRHLIGCAFGPGTLGPGESVFKILQTPFPWDWYGAAISHFGDFYSDYDSGNTVAPATTGYELWLCDSMGIDTYMVMLNGVPAGSVPIGTMAVGLKLKNTGTVGVYTLLPIAYFTVRLPSDPLLHEES